MSTPRPLTVWESRAVTAVGVATGALGLLGFVNSFARVQAAVHPSFGWLAWTVPLGIDLAIAIFSALDIVFARLDMRTRWLRFIPWILVAATIYLNVANETTLVGQVAHAALPGLWIVAVEVGAHAVRVRAGLASATRMDRIRKSRWFLAPTSTVTLWRRMILWETRSYPNALARERDRVLALADLQDAYGRMWRWRAPRKVRALYRLGELAPAEVTDRLALPSSRPVPRDAGQPETATVVSPVTAVAQGPPPVSPAGGGHGEDEDTTPATLDRPDVTAALKRAGLSTKEIADQIGASKRTVQRDLERWSEITGERFPEPSANGAGPAH